MISNTIFCFRMHFNVFMKTNEIRKIIEEDTTHTHVATENENHFMLC